MLEALLDFNVNLHPETCMLDLEKAAKNAFAACFPASTINVCFFHLGQCLWRKIQEFHLGTLYVSDEEIRKHCKWLLSLAFVPFVRQELIPLYDHWESTYVGAQRRGRKLSRYIKLKAGIKLVAKWVGLPCTNNSVEGWHHGFQSMIGSEYPQIYSFIKSILKVCRYEFLTVD